jgi:hypothetical protein
LTGSSQPAAPSAASPSKTAENRIAANLGLAMATGRLRNSRLSPVVRDCLLLPDVTPARDYDFGKLEEAICLADELMDEAAELIALGKNAQQEVVFAIGYVIVGLVQVCEPSIPLKRLIVDVCEALVGLDEIGGSIRWRKGSREALYRDALFAESPVDEAVNSILEKVIRL